MHSGKAFIIILFGPGQDFRHPSNLASLLIYSYVGVMHWPVVSLGLLSVNIRLGLHGIGHGV